MNLFLSDFVSCSVVVKVSCAVRLQRGKEIYYKRDKDVYGCRDNPFCVSFIIYVGFHSCNAFRKGWRCGEMVCG